MNIFIPQDKEVILNKKSLFVILKPFFQNGQWVNNNSYYNWNLNRINIVTDLKKSDVLCIPMPINYYYENKMIYLIKKYNEYCEKFKITGFGIISGDFGMEFPEFNDIVYFRMSGFRSSLSLKNQGFPASLSDQYKKIYETDEILIREKSLAPRIGFCGHATSNKLVYIKQSFKFFFENFKRFFQNPFRKDYEPLFQSGLKRFNILKNIENNKNLHTNFIYREKYRAGFKNLDEKKRTTIEYYDNILSSDYIICIRGTGNFSIRLYETLMMGRIPIFIDTDCLLPFTDKINWEKHIIQINWSDINNLPQIILNFHNNISDSNFKKQQKKNRELWLEKLNPSWLLQNILHFRN